VKLVGLVSEGKGLLGASNERFVSVGRAVDFAEFRDFLMLSTAADMKVRQKGGFDSVSARHVTPKPSKLGVCLFKDRHLVRVSASRSAELSEFRVLIGRMGFATTPSIPHPTLNEERGQALVLGLTCGGRWTCGGAQWWTW
jgi:hypothetical protein